MHTQSDTETPGPQPGGRGAGLDTLAGSLDGTIVVPLDDGFAAACAAWNLAWTHRPAGVVVAASVRDVVVGVAHARAHGLKVAVQTTGHGVTVPADEQSLLIDLSALDAVSVDPDACTATVGGGATWAPVLAAAQQHGLAPLLGSAPDVGAVGYTVGGGFGWLARKHGLAVDAVRSLRVVLADGRTVTVSPAHGAELFWGLCGAGAGSLGVVVEMTVDLVPVTDVYAGNLYYPIDVAREVFDVYRRWAADVPDELTSAFTVTAFPPLDLVPEPVRGKSFAIVRGCHCGDLAEGKAWVDRWRHWRAPLLDDFRPMPFARCAAISSDPVDPVPVAISGRWLSALTTDVADRMLHAVVGDPGSAPLLFAEARQAGGAVAADNPTVSYAGRSGASSLELVGLITSPRADDDLARRTAQVWEGLDLVLADRPGYLNFTDGQERVAAARTAFSPDAWHRLQALKRAVDPTDLFSHGVDLTC